jgi:hypothetical protein
MKGKPGFKGGDLRWKQIARNDVANALAKQAGKLLQETALVSAAEATTSNVEISVAVI